MVVRFNTRKRNKRSTARYEALFLLVERRRSQREGICIWRWIFLHRIPANEFGKGWDQFSLRGIYVEGRIAEVPPTDGA